MGVLEKGGIMRYLGLGRGGTYDSRRCSRYEEVEVEVRVKRVRSGKGLKLGGKVIEIERMVWHMENMDREEQRREFQ
jgi:hypothetical protein